MKNKIIIDLVKQIYSLTKDRRKLSNALNKEGVKRIEISNKYDDLLIDYNDLRHKYEIELNKNSMLGNANRNQFDTISKLSNTVNELHIDNRRVQNAYDNSLKEIENLNKIINDTNNINNDLENMLKYTNREIKRVTDNHQITSDNYDELLEKYNNLVLDTQLNDTATDDGLNYEVMTSNTEVIPYTDEEINKIKEFNDESKESKDIMNNNDWDDQELPF